jgi:hypothetical protein
MLHANNRAPRQHSTYFSIQYKQRIDPEQIMLCIKFCYGRKIQMSSPSAVTDRDLSGELDITHQTYGQDTPARFHQPVAGHPDWDTAVTRAA